MRVNNSNLNWTIGSDPRDNLVQLGRCAYLGRGIVAGVMENGNLVVVYWLTGRSSGSQNRVLRTGFNGTVRTDLADPSKGCGDPDLTIYPAIRTHDDLTVVSNGSQTERFLNGMTAGHIFEQLNAHEMYEPDPSSTSRITCAVSRGTSSDTAIQFGSVRKTEFSDAPEHTTVGFTKHTPGLGHCIVTYAMDSKTPDGLIPAFRRSPFPVPIQGNITRIADRYWAMLGEDLRVALVAKEIPFEGEPTTVLRNRHEVPAEVAA